MMILRLFHQSDPFHQIDERPLDTGSVVIGRGKDADWTLADPARLLSRRHCSIRIEGERALLEDMSVNGVFVGTARERASPSAPMPLRPGESLRLGEYLIIVDVQHHPAPLDGPKPQIVDSVALRTVEALADRIHVNEKARCQLQISAATELNQPARDEGSLLEAFCAGARLDASALADEDPAEVMRKLGAIYQEMIRGLTDLMDERNSLKTEYRMDRTTVRSAGNNPFRWAGAQRLAIDLLRERGDGFLSGSSAVKVSFADIKKHLICILAGVEATFDATLKALSPKAIEAHIPMHAALLRGRNTVAWAQYAAAHKALENDPAGPDGFANGEFSAAYGRKLQELDAADEASG